MGDEALYVENIVPLGKRELSEDEYNSILADFERHVLQKIQLELEVESELTLHRVVPEAFLSPETARRLRLFSTSANKLSLVPADRERWKEFIVQSHIEEADFDPPLLDEWLAEQGWPDEPRQHLVSEYETARSVLGAYDEERLPKCFP